MAAASSSQKEIDDDLDGLEHLQSGHSEINKDSSQYLTFIMANQEYGVDILSVDEIRGWEVATLLPSAPSYIKGVLNLRGIIVPILDTRQLFDLPTIDVTPVTVIIVLTVTSGTSNRIVGIVVDEISDVYTIDNDDIRDPPDVGASIETNYIHGFAEVNQKMVVLLEMNQLLNLDGLPNLSSMPSQG